MNERIDNWASQILEELSEILPDVQDDALLGKLVLEKALETYNAVSEVELGVGSLT